MKNLDMTETRSTDDVGTWKARWYRYRYLVGYLILLAAVLFSIARVSGVSQEGRENLQRSARVVVLEGCKRDNDTRAAVRRIIRRSARELPKYLAEGVINKEQYKRAVDANRDALALLGPADCLKSAAIIQD